MDCVLALLLPDFGVLSLVLWVLLFGLLLFVIMDCFGLVLFVIVVVLLRMTCGLVLRPGLCVCGFMATGCMFVICAVDSVVVGLICCLLVVCLLVVV